MADRPISTTQGDIDADVLRALLETLDAGNVGLSIVAVDVDPPEYLFMNAGGAARLGYTVEELRQIPVWQLFEPADLTAVRTRQGYGATQPSGTHQFEIYIKHRSGRRIPLEVTTNRVVFKGRPANVSFTHDASSRVEAVRALEASEARFRLLVESAPDGVVILRGTTLSYMNSAAATMLGFETPDELLGKAITSFLYPPDAVRAESRIEQLQRTGKRFADSAEYRARRRDGSEISVEISSMPIEFEGAPATLAVARDITERKAMHEKMVQADRLAAVGTLAAGIAHEVNNPLAYVLLGLQYLERELPKLAIDPSRLTDALARVSEIKTGAERVGGIVSGLKMFARADDAERGPVDVRAVVDSAIKIADNELRHRARLTRTYETNALVHGNAARLEQVFLNLLVNAAHAVSDLEPARAEIHVRIIAPPGDRVLVEVSDNGVGIPKDVLPRVFDPFFTTKPVGIGTGLGLPICRSIVEGFGGTIGIESAQGRGTKVAISLPAFIESPSLEGDEVPATQSLYPPPDRGRILVIDDEPLVAALLGRMLSPDHDVAVATSASEALAIMEEQTFDVIICDVMMPGTTGMDLYGIIRAKDPRLAGRIVFVTGGAFVPRIADFLASVENPKLDKPIDVKGLLRTVREIRNRG